MLGGWGAYTLVRPALADNAGRSGHKVRAADDRRISRPHAFKVDNRRISDRLDYCCSIHSVAERTILAVQSCRAFARQANEELTAR